MTKITLNVEDEYMDEFLNELEKFEKENKCKEGDLKIFGLSVQEFKKTREDFNKSSKE